MKEKIKKSYRKYFWIVALALMSFGSKAFGQTSSGIEIPCDGSADSPCGFPELIILIDNSILFILKYMIMPISAVIILYAGFKYLTSGGNPGKRTEANKLFVNLLWGLFFCLAAWVIVKIILTTFGYDDTTFSPIVE